MTDYDFFKNPVPTGGSNPPTTVPDPVPTAPPAEAPADPPVPSSADGGGEQPAPALVDEIRTLLSGAGTVTFNLRTGLVLAAVVGLLLWALVRVFNR